MMAAHCPVRLCCVLHGSVMSDHFLTDYITFGKNLHCTCHLVSEVDTSQTLKLGSQQGEEFRKRSIATLSRSLLTITTGSSASMSASSMLHTSPRSQGSPIHPRQSLPKHISSLDCHGSRSTTSTFLWQTTRLRPRPSPMYNLSRGSTLPVRRRAAATVKLNVGIVHMRWRPSPYHLAAIHSAMIAPLPPSVRNAIGG